ncbi:MAG: phosphoribosylformylglycinamidine synthase II, partial [Methanoregulaceae archaeon]|nr:phosphoribosylformylglycinamidine synthase II [Methanoregulaceae archaeon]
RDLSEDSEAADRPSVQIGDPFTEKLLIEAILEMAATKKIFSCRDLGAAGLAGASSEMCSTFGGLIHADRVHQREPDMRPVEIMLAESQERMLVEVDPGDVPLMGKIAEKYDLRWSDIGEVIDEPRYIVRFHGKTVADMPIDFLCGNAPECIWEQRPYNQVRQFTVPEGDLRSHFLSVLSHPEVAGKHWIWEQYDREVQVRTIRCEGDAALLRLDGEGLAFSCGCNPRHIHLAPFAGTANAVYENAANLTCVGAEPLCLVNCLNFASPVHPEIFWQLAESVKGMGEMARRLEIPVVGGNVSLYNESDEMCTQIKPTPSIGMVGRSAPEMRFAPREGMGLALLGITGEHFGGSVLDAVFSCGGAPPPIADHSLLDGIRRLVQDKPYLVVTDLSQGGLASALALFCPGAEVEVGNHVLTTLFSETYGRFLIAFSDEKDLEGFPYQIIGKVTNGGICVQSGDDIILEVSAADIAYALGSLSRIMKG